MKTIFLVLIFLSQQSYAAQAKCKDLDSGAAFFSGEKQSWMHDKSMKIIACANSYSLVFIENKTNKELDRVSIEKPAASQKWYLDGLSCNENGMKTDTTVIYRNKAILSPRIEETQALKPIAVWAPNKTTNKLEKLSLSSISCQKDEP